VSNDGANVVVKNTTITTASGTLPADHVETVDTAQMRSIPWMLGIKGTENVRATNLLGSSSKASYIDSTIMSDGWGVLSTDSGSGCTLTTINSTVNTKDSSGAVAEGYGSYAIRLSKLILALGATVAGAGGKTVAMTVNDTSAPIAAGTHCGAIVLSAE